MQEYYRNEENCVKELLLAREVMGNKNTTKEQFEGMEKSLAFMYLYAPDKLSEYAYNTLMEAGMRKVYFNFK